MQLYKRGKYYWYKFTWNGQSVRGSTRVSNLRNAGDIAAACRTALAKGEVGITTRKRIPAFPAAMNAFLQWSESEHQAKPATARRYKTSSVALLRHFKATPMDAITSADVERFKAERSAEFTTVRAKDKRVMTEKKVRPATVNRELACLRAMFNHAIKGEILLRNPVSYVKFSDEQNQQERVLSYKEQRQYLAAATPTLQDVAGLILETGMRPEEVYTLQRTAVDLRRGFLKVTEGKTKAAKRTLDLTPEARRILTSRLAAVEGPYLFPHAADAEKPIPKINNAHDRAVRDSKVAPFRLYDCRHTFATRLAEAGVDLVTLAAIMGHSRIQMVMRYAHPTQKHQASAMGKLAAHNAAREREELETEET